jgi:hypothetical protein
MIIGRFAAALVLVAFESVVKMELFSCDRRLGRLFRVPNGRLIDC